MLLQILGWPDFGILRKEVNFRANAEKAKNDHKKDAQFVEPLFHFGPYPFNTHDAITKR